MPLRDAHWKSTIESHFVICTFLGLVVVQVLREPLSRMSKVEGGPPIGEVLLGSVIAGLVVAACTWFIHRLVIQDLRKKYFRDRGDDVGRKAMIRGMIVGFVFGAMGPVYLFARGLIPILALLFLLLIFRYAGRFLRRAGIILRPGRFPAPVDVLHLVFLYAALIACFTILNVALTSLDHQAFRGIGDAVAGPDGVQVEGTSVIGMLYFTIVTMTTLGYGDITPQSLTAKLIVSLEVVIAYLFFALLIGTITRGILPQEDPEESAQDDSTESR